MGIGFVQSLLSEFPTRAHSCPSDDETMNRQLGVSRSLPQQRALFAHFPFFTLSPNLSDSLPMHGAAVPAAIAGDSELTHPIGSGSFAVVWLGRRRLTRAPIADRLVPAPSLVRSQP
jgi:hypothetical protein